MGIASMNFFAVGAVVICRRIIGHACCNGEMMNDVLAAYPSLFSLFFLQERRRFVLAKDSLLEVTAFANSLKSDGVCKPCIIFWRNEIELVMELAMPCWKKSLGAGASLSV